MNMKKAKTIVAASIFFALLVGSVKAENDRPLHEIHSMMVFNFVKYINWPAHSISGEFIIGVVGSDDVYNTLKSWYQNKNIGSQKILVKKFNSASEITDCHVIYVGKDGNKDFDLIKSKTEGKSTLIVTDKAGFGAKGSGINFKTVEGKLKFELNQAAIEKAHLKVSSQLTGMAIII